MSLHNDPEIDGSAILTWEEIEQCLQEAEARLKAASEESGQLAGAAHEQDLIELRTTIKPRP